MPEETTVPEEVAFTVCQRTFREAALYVASFVTYVSQHADRDGRVLPVELVASGLSPQDQRVLR